MDMTNEFLGRYLLYFKYIKNIDEVNQFVSDLVLDIKPL